MRGVEKERAAARKFLAKLDQDYESGGLGIANYERLTARQSERLQNAEQVLERLSSRLGELENQEDASIDHLLDKANALARILEGGMGHGDKLLLNERLTAIFERFIVTLEGEAVVITPTLRAGLVESDDWLTLDFSDGQAKGVEVVEYLVPPVLRRVNLWGDELTYSS